jgi:hypothetical protein
MTLEDYYRRDRIKIEKHGKAAELRMAKRADVQVLMVKANDIFRRLALAIVVQYDKSPDEHKHVLNEHLLTIKHGYENLSDSLDDTPVVVGNKDGL